MRLEVKNGSFSYNEKEQVLKEINFVLEQGEVLSVLGPNGAGKTTLLRCVLGFLKWTGGEALFDGKTFSNVEKKEFWKMTAYVPQAKSLVFAYNTEEMVLMGRNPYLSLFAHPGKEDRKKAMEAMQECGIAHLIGKRCDEISGGELQLVLIARALTQQPQLLVMDEPETGLDFRNQLRVLRLIEKLSHERKLSVIFNTHYPEHALRISDKTLLVRKDGTALFGRKDDILKDEIMKEAFGVEVCTISKEINGRTYSAMIPLDEEGGEL